MSWQGIPPEVADLLGELSDDADAAVRKFVARPRPKIRDSAKPVDAVIKELESVYPHQVAVVLGQAADRLLHEDPYWSGLFHKSARVGESRSVRTSNHVARQAARLAAGASRVEEDELQQELGTLGRVAGMVSPQPSTLDLALLSWRLTPVDNVAIIAAHEYMRLKEWQSCDRFLHEVIDAPLNRFNASFAWEALGVAQLRRGQLADAELSFQKAANSGDERPTPLCSWFIVSSRLNDRSSAEEASKRLEEMVQPDDLSVDASIEAFRGLRRRGIFDARLGEAPLLPVVPAGSATDRIRDALS